MKRMTFLDEIGELPIPVIAGILPSVCVHAETLFVVESDRELV